MARRPAAASLTGGAGFNFEDSIAAWCLLHMLREQCIFEPELGSITFIDWQAKDAGWLLDDLVLRLQDAQGNEHWAAISFKRDRQVTSSGFPKNFVHDVWEQWLKANSKPFEKDRDLFVLMVGELADGVETAWNGLLKEALTTEPSRFVERLGKKEMLSKTKRDLFESLRCPSDLVSGNLPSDEEVVHLLRHIRLCRFDFHKPSSRNLSEALHSAAETVKNGQPSDAEQLWISLQDFAKKHRETGGSTDLAKILQSLDRLNLNPRPSFKCDWKRLLEISEESVERICDSIGGNLVVKRTKLWNDTNAILDNHNLCVLLGLSGSGKSAVAKQIYLNRKNNHHTVFLDSQSLDHISLSSMAKELGLQHDPIHLISELPESSGTLFVDGIDRLEKESLSTASKVVAAASKNPKWSICITCTQDAWDRVLSALIKAELLVNSDSIFMVPSFDQDELSQVTKSFPQLSVCALRSEIQPFLRIPKILDWIVDGLNLDSDKTEIIVDLPSLARSLWNKWIKKDGDDRHERSELLKQIANAEADNLSQGIPIGQVASSLLCVLSQLEDDHIVEVDNKEKIRFKHDLLGDWARLYVLIEQNSKIAQFIVNKCLLPRWHNAIQLYGQWLLSMKDEGVTSWQRLLESLEGKEHKAVAQDLLLDSIILGIDQQRLLFEVWPQLILKDGYLLRRLLNRFLHVATIPDPRAAQLLHNAQSVSVQATFRIPFWPLWLPMLNALVTKAQENLISLVPDLVAKIVHLWLTQTPVLFDRKTPFPGRYSAAKLALMCGREFQARLEEDVYSQEDDDLQKGWEALLAAANELPDEVVQIALELSGRRELSEEILKRKAEAKKQKREEVAKRLAAETKEEREARENRFRGVQFGSVFPEGEMLPPWPNGPTREIEKSWRNVCLSSNAILPLFAVRPVEAREAFLAACIEAPHREDPWEAPDMFDTFETWAWHDNTRPMFFKGPFLGLLQQCPNDAIEIICNLVDFATNRWEEWDKSYDRREDESKSDLQRIVKMLYEKQVVELKGDLRVYGWYRDRFGSADVIVAALMALEKWLYELIENDKDVESWLKMIIERARSVAILGILVTVARKEPTLLVGPLRPLMSIWEIYSWEHTLFQEELLKTGWQISMMQWSRWGEDIYNIVKNWHELSHRKVDFREVCIKCFLTHKTVQDSLEPVKAWWRDQLPQSANTEALETLTEIFTLSNWENKDGLYYEFKHPRDYAQRTQIEAQYNMRALTFPLKCRQILDGEQKLQLENCDEFWQEMQELWSAQNLPENAGTTSLREDISCGGIAVLLRFHKEWLFADEKRVQWCGTRLNKVLSAPPPRPVYDSPESIGTIFWDYFWSECAIMLLADDPENESIREWGARAIIQNHYAATNCAIQVAWREREQLGPDLIRLINLSFLWAGIRHVLSMAQRCDLQQETYLHWLNRFGNYFVHKKLSGEYLLDCARLNCFFARINHRLEQKAWAKQQYDKDGTIALSPDHPLARRAMARHSSSVRWPGLDTQVLSTIMGMVSELSSSAEIRRIQVNLMHQMLNLVLWCLEGDTADNDDDTQDIDGTPHDFHCNIFRLIALNMPRFCREEHPEQFWQPIFDLGSRAHYWVESFLTSWFMCGFPAFDEKREPFFRLWSQMIEYAELSPKWKIEKGRTWADVPDMWARLMGLHFGSHALWKDPDCVSYMQTMEPLYHRWAEKWITDHSTLSEFAHFVTSPAGSVLLRSGLIWLTKSARKIAQNNHHFIDAAKALASACAYCWEHERENIQSTPELKTAFLDLLALLIEYNQPEALQLRDEIIKT